MRATEPAAGMSHISRNSAPRSTPAATLAVIDLAGRLRFMRDVTELGAGSHTVALDGTRTLEPGVYFLALRRDGSAPQSIRFAVVR